MDIDITDEEENNADNNKDVDGSHRDDGGGGGCLGNVKEEDEGNNQQSLLPVSQIKKEKDTPEKEEEEKEDEKEEDGFNDSQRKSFGGDISDQSYLSDEQNSTPRYSMRSRGRPKLSINPQEHRQLSTQDVQILSDPGLIKKLESFQSGEETDTEMLKNPKLLKLLRTLHVPETISPESEAQDTEKNEKLSSPGLLPQDEIKVEGKGKKRKLSGLGEFQQAWKTTPKRKKKDGDSVKYSVGSPPKGVLLTKDSTREDLVKLQTARVQQMAKLDTLLKKNPTSSKKCSESVFHQVRVRCLFFDVAKCFVL